MRFDFTRTEYEYFLRECGFTELELKILEYKRKGPPKSYDMYIAEELCYSEKTIQRNVKSIKEKIIKVL